MISILLKLIGVLVVVAVIGLVGFAYFGDLSPVGQDVRTPVVLDVD